MLLSNTKTIKRYFNIHFYLFLLLLIVFFSLPLNTFLIWKPSWTYWQGHFIDYWAPKLYLSQLLLLLLGGHLAVWSIATRGRPFQSLKKRLRNNRHLLLLATLTLILGLFLAGSDRSAPAAWVWVVTLFFGPGLLFLILPFFSKTQLAVATLLTSTFQASLALWQWSTQTPYLPYAWLGEPRLAPFADIATSTFSPYIRFLPYGSTPHPNVLAAWLLVGILAAFFLWNRTGFSRWILLLAVSALGGSLFLTESLSAWLTTLFFLIYWHIPHNWWMRITPQKDWSRTALLAMIPVVGTLITAFGLWIIELNTRNWEFALAATRRGRLLSFAHELFVSYPWGTGWMQHLTHLTLSQFNQLGPGFVQPIHNFWVLFVIELGVWSIFVCVAFSFFAQRLYSFRWLTILSLAPIFYLDHYFYTLLGGQYALLLMCVLLLFSNE